MLPMFRHAITRGVAILPQDREIWRALSRELNLTKAFESAVQVDVSNVATAEAGQTLPETRHCTGIVSPWDLAWYEWSATDFDLSKEVSRFAAMVMTAKYEQPDHESVRAMFLSAPEPDQELLATLPLEGFIAHRLIFAFFRGRPTYVSSVVDLCDAQGNPVLGKDGRHHGAAIVYHEAPGVVADAGRYAGRITVLAAMFANCRNVERVDVLPNRQERRQLEREDIANVIHKVLVIDPKMSVKRGASTPVVGALDARRLHICRGHFVTYTPERPLFGKYAGRFWKPAHVRGREDRGAVVKDYDILAGAV